MMSDFVICVDGLGKRYHIRAARNRHDTYSDIIAGFLQRSSPSVFDRSGELWALKDVYVAAKRGGVEGIIERIGARKSILQKILSRITGGAGGRVEIRDRVASSLEIGTGSPPKLKGRKDIYLNVAIVSVISKDVDIVI